MLLCPNERVLGAVAKIPLLLLHLQLLLFISTVLIIPLLDPEHRLLYSMCHHGFALAYPVFSHLPVRYVFSYLTPTVSSIGSRLHHHQN